ncbi:unnamed protein product [Nezara viridula]|uniref:Uncharacterized protein n=1 Tax=Nezara viridula TaxID=85310 RepID=A0A9P0HE39_NEZVI|nr:unnamed protein product [Nezara viridula]
MWVCTTFYKYQVEASNNDLQSIKPCRSFCHRVEQKCPFFLPLDKGPVHYAGEPAFLCLDPNIEETGEQLEKSSYGPSTCCYDACGSDVCLQGNCEVAEAVTDSETSSSSSRTLVATPLIVPLLLYRTRLLLI